MLSAVEPNSQREKKTIFDFKRGGEKIECTIRKNGKGEIKDVYTEG